MASPTRSDMASTEGATMLLEAAEKTVRAANAEQGEDDGDEGVSGTAAAGAAGSPAEEDAMSDHSESDDAAVAGKLGARATQEEEDEEDEEDEEGSKEGSEDDGAGNLEGAGADFEVASEDDEGGRGDGGAEGDAEVGEEGRYRIPGKRVLFTAEELELRKAPCEECVAKGSPKDCLAAKGVGLKKCSDCKFARTHCSWDPNQKKRERSTTVKPSRKTTMTPKVKPRKKKNVGRRNPMVLEPTPEPESPNKAIGGVSSWHGGRFTRAVFGNVGETASKKFVPSPRGPVPRVVIPAPPVVTRSSKRTIAPDSSDDEVPTVRPVKKTKAESPRKEAAAEDDDDDDVVPVVVFRPQNVVNPAELADKATDEVVAIRRKVRKTFKRALDIVNWPDETSAAVMQNAVNEMEEAFGSGLLSLKKIFPKKE